jgi:hypothetical protein
MWWVHSRCVDPTKPSTWPFCQGDHRSYASNFFDAVTTRQAASLCREGVDRRRTFELLDAKIEAFNDLIAT